MMDYYRNEVTTEMTILMDASKETLINSDELWLHSASLHSNLTSNESSSQYYNNNNLSDPHFMDSSLVEDLYNVTSQSPLEYAMVMYGYIMPFLVVITIVANTLIVLVLAQRHMRTPTNLVLLAMAIADLLTLLFPSPWYFYMYTLGNHDKILYPPSACYAYHCMIEVVPAFFHTASIWLTLLLAGQR